MVSINMVQILAYFHDHVNKSISGFAAAYHTRVNPRSKTGWLGSNIEASFLRVSDELFLSIVLVHTCTHCIALVPAREHDCHSSCLCTLTECLELVSANFDRFILQLPTQNPVKCGKYVLTTLNSLKWGICLTPHWSSEAL